MGIGGILWSSSMKIESFALGAIAATLTFIFLGIGIVKPDSNFHEDKANNNEETSI
jgi:hypothetical protein